MKLIWLGYLVYNVDNCIMKLYIVTGLRLCLLLIFFKTNTVTFLFIFNKYYCLFNLDSAFPATIRGGLPLIVVEDQAIQQTKEGTKP